MSLEQLAEQLGWDAGRISKYENDYIALSYPVMQEIAGVLGMPPLAMALRCLKHKHPELSNPRSKVGRLLDQAVDELTK